VLRRECEHSPELMTRRRPSRHSTTPRLSSIDTNSMLNRPPRSGELQRLCAARQRSATHGAANRLTEATRTSRSTPWSGRAVEHHTGSAALVAAVGMEAGATEARYNDRTAAAIRSAPPGVM
jgi:hypothetical protein